jgi:phosphoglycerate dehydrogenase-like enzyme
VPDRPVVVVDPHHRRMDGIFSPDDRARLESLAEVVWGRDEPMPIEELRAALPRALALVCGGWRYGDQLDGAVESAERLRAIMEVSGAFPRGLPYRICFARGIRVLSCAPSFAPQVAEMALGMALAASREIVHGHELFRRGQEQWGGLGNQSTFLLYDQPVGFVGYGSLARALRPLLAPFRCPISVYDPWLSEGYLRSEGLRPLDLEPLLAESRVIFVLATPTTENRALITRELMERIRPDAVFALISRAHAVDFDALTELVLAGRFRAAIDVFPIEPLPPDHPIRTAPNVVLSAHRAGSVREGLWEIGRLVVDDLEMIARGLPPRRMQVGEPELVGRYTASVVRPDRA